MGTKSFVLFLCISLLGISAAVVPGTEDQRKFAVPDLQLLDSFIINSEAAGDLHTQYEGAYMYYDIYLDTPDFDLYKNQLSLRFRKRELGTESTYSLQLKSEMDTGSSVRMEVEEPELDIYKVKRGENWVPLISALNVLFNQLKEKNIQPDGEKAQKAIAEIQGWVQLKIEGPVAPFQKLSHLQLKGLNTEKLKTIRPVVYGSDVRKRSHVYLDTLALRGEFKGQRFANKTGAELPYFFGRNPNYIWALETSLDAAVFYPILKSKAEKLLINEYEVENKYFDHGKGTLMMNSFENYLIKNFKLSKNKDSKYYNSVKTFWQ